MSGITLAFLVGRVLLVLAGLCGPWRIADLERDDGAERGAACVRGVAGLERGGT